MQHSSSQQLDQLQQQQMQQVFSYIHMDIITESHIMFHEDILNKCFFSHRSGWEVLQFPNVVLTFC